MFRAACRNFALSFVCLSAHPGVTADTVVLDGKPPFENVTITDVRRGRLFFRGVSGETLQKPLGLVCSVAVAGLPELDSVNQALATGDFDTAVAALAECERLAREPWQRTLVRYRRLAVLSAAGRTDQALTVFLELVREDPQTPAENLPANIGPTGSHANRAALAILRKSRLRGITPALEQALTVRRLELTLLEEPEAARREFATRDDADVVAASSQPSEEDDAPLLFGSPRAAPTGTPIELSRASPLLKEADRLLADGNARDALRLIERAAPFVRPADRDWWTLCGARCRIALREFARAADELLAVATRAENPAGSIGKTRGSPGQPDRALAGWSLYYVGLAHEGLNRPDVAADQYRELRSREDLPADLRATVESALERLKSKIVP